MQASASNTATHSTQAGNTTTLNVENAPSSDVFATLLAALGNQAEAKGVAALLTVNALTAPDTTPSPNANPSAAGSLGANLHALLSALHDAAAKPSEEDPSATHAKPERDVKEDDAPATPAPPAPGDITAAAPIDVAPLVRVPSPSTTGPLPQQAAPPAPQPTALQRSQVLPQTAPEPTTPAPVAREATTATAETPAVPIASILDASKTGKSAASPFPRNTNDRKEPSREPVKPVPTITRDLAVAPSASVQPSPATRDQDDGDNASGDNSKRQHAGEPDTAPVNRDRLESPKTSTETTTTPAAAPSNPVVHKSDAPSGGAAVASSSAPTTPTSAAPSSLHANLHIAPASDLPDTNALALTIAARSQAGAKHFDIRLDPPELGRVDVRLTVDDAGKAQAALSVDKPQTLELLQKDAGNLERALKDAGFDLAQNGLNFSLKGEQQDSDTPRGRTFNARAIASDETTLSPTSLSGVSDARLDIRV